MLVPLRGQRVQHLPGAVDLAAHEKGHGEVVREQGPAGDQLTRRGGRVPVAPASGGAGAAASAPSSAAATSGASRVNLVRVARVIEVYILNL